MRGELKKGAAQADHPDEDFVSVAEACERSGLSRSAMFELIRQHDLKRYRKPRDCRTYLALRDLEAVTSKMPRQQRELIQTQGEELRGRPNHGPCGPAGVEQRQ
jgi:hypothetical protein